MSLTVVFTLYAACVAGAVVLAPQPVTVNLLAFAFVVWLGGVTFTLLWRALDERQARHAVRH